MLSFTPEALLAIIMEELTEEKGELIVSTWFGSAKAVAVHEDMLIIYVSNVVSCETLKNRFTENVAEILRKRTGEPLVPLYITGESELLRWQGLAAGLTAQDYTFENFIVGNSNKFAYSAALSVAKDPAKNYNPLFIYGYPGLGKTHLLHSIAYEVKKTHPDFRISYIKGDEFINEFLESIAQGKNTEFRMKYRTADMLLVDDIQFIAGKERTQEEFFHTFNALHEAGKQIVLTSDRPPKELITLEERLRSRFEWGLVADISAPDFETRIVLVEAKAKKVGIELTRDVTEYIATLITNNVRQLEGVVKKIAAVHSMLHQPVGLTLAKYVINEIYKETPGITPDIIVKAVSEYFDVPVDKIMGNYRLQNFVNARHVAVYLMREMTEMKLQEIAKYMNKDHTSIMYSLRRIGDIVHAGSDPVICPAVFEIRRSLENK